MKQRPGIRSRALFYLKSAVIKLILAVLLYNIPPQEDPDTEQAEATQQEFAGFGYFARKVVISVFVLATNKVTPSNHCQCSSVEIKFFQIPMPGSASPSSFRPPILSEVVIFVSRGRTIAFPIKKTSTDIDKKKKKKNFLILDSSFKPK
jgi:hypothetical protein